MSLKGVNFDEISGKRVLLRVDINVPVVEGIPEEGAERLDDAFSTIQRLHQAGAVTIVLSHRGRPDGVDPSLSLEPIARALIERLPKGVGRFVGASDYATVANDVTASADGDVLFLENLRFHPGEKSGDHVFAGQLADLGDLYVNDAFANCHRDHASMTGIPQFLPSYAGPNVLDELKKLEPVRNPTRRPFVAIVGGAKISSKLHALEALLKKADQVFVGGALATAFFLAQGKEMGTSYVHKEDIPLAKKLLKYTSLRLPSDLVVRVDGGYTSLSPDAITNEAAVEDIGPQAIAEIQSACQSAKLILWNGPLGVIEKPQTRVASDAVAHIVAEVARGSAYGVVGGGDTVGIPDALGLSDLIDHVSTGGSAMLEYVGDQALPALTALTSSKQT